MNKTVLKIAGVAGVVIGAVCLFLGGVSEVTVGAIVGGVFVLAGVIAGVFGLKKG